MNVKRDRDAKKTKAVPYVIYGKVTEKGGQGVADAQITLWQQLIRERRPLAKGKTSHNGEYRLEYHPPKDFPGLLLLVVEACSDCFPKPLTSPLTPAQSSLQVNLGTEPVDSSEFTTLMRAIRLLLDGLPMLDVVENTRHQDISFLAKETGKSTEQIMRVIVAERLQKAFSVPASAFYAFLRQNVPSALPSPLLEASDDFTLIDSLVQNSGSLIFALPSTLQQSTLVAAVALNLIGPEFTPRIPRIVTLLQALHTTDLLKQPFLVGTATLGQLLGVVALTPAKQKAFAQALATNTQTMGNFWRTLGDGEHGFTQAEASSIQRVLSVGSFVKNYLPLVTTLVQGFTAGTYQTLANLAQITLPQWIQMVKQTGTPPGIDATDAASSAEVFASVVYARITRAYPTVALASRIVNANLVPPEQQKSLVTFFQNNPELELVTDNLPAYLASQGAQAFAGIAAKDQSAVIANARGFQRLLRVAPTTDVAQTLIGLGFTSATQIAALGRQQFFVKATAAGLTKPEASQAFQAASVRYASLVSLYMKFNQGALGVLPQSIGSLSDFSPAIQEAVQLDPTLTTLFGSQDYCAVNDCTSVLSPAAYLCDLLLWLRNHPLPSGTVLDVLNGRRPDIGNLLLNCPNSDTELPYIDLVIELLADAVSPPPATTLAAAISSTAQSPIIVTASTGFPAPNFFITIGAEVLLVTAVSGAGNTVWTVQRGQQETTASTASAGTAVTLPINPPWKQTTESATSAQLSAAPAYFNQGAFVTLFSASYPPYSLPYSTGLDLLRTCLQQWNLPLWQLRQALLPVGGGTVAQQAAVAAERLGMNLQAENLVTIQDFVTAEVAWNVSDFSITPLTGLAIVPNFLQAAGITYEQLLELLNVTWVQGGLGISLVGLNANCNTSLMTLAPAPLDTGFLDRAHRFLCLWPATGYKMWELDLLLNAHSVGGGSLNQQTLVALQDFWQLQNATGLSVARQLAFYQDIDTATHLDPDGTTTTSLYSQIFLNPTITWLASDLDLATLPTGGVIGDPVLSDHVQSIQPALGVSSSDFTTLVALTDNQLTLDNLSLMYRVNALAVAAKFSISNLLKVASLLSPAAGTLATTLVSPIINGIQNTIIVLSAAAFPPPNFYIQIGGEILLVTAVGGPGNNTWTVLREQLGTHAAASVAPGMPVTADTASPLPPALALLFSSPAATLAFLAQAAAVQQQSSLTLDAITYLVTAPSALTGGWPTTSQMTPANIATTLAAVQEAVATLEAASTTLVSPITSSLQTTITVAGNTGFPPPNFYINIGPEVLLVTAVDGSGNTTWTVVRGQQNTTAVASVLPGAAVTPTNSDLDGVVITAVAANAHPANGTPLASDVSALILETLEVPGTGSTLLAVLEAPVLAAAAGTITISGAPLAGDTLQVVLTNGGGSAVTVAYPLTTADSGSLNQTASDFAQAIDASAAVAGPQAFLAPCTVSGAVITLVPLTPGVAGSSVTSVNTTIAGATHVSISPGVTVAPTGTLTIDGVPTAGDVLQTVLNDGIGDVFTVTCTLTPADGGNLSQAASDFAAAINASPAVVGPQAFLAPCTSSLAIITLTALPGLAAGVNITSANTAIPIVAQLSPGSAQTIGQPAFQNQFLAIQLFDKVAALVRGLKLVATDLTWLLNHATGTITIGGTPTAGDTLQAVLSNDLRATVTVSYTLSAADGGSVNQTASDFAAQINLSPAVVGAQAFLAPCTVSGAAITLAPLTPGMIGSSVASVNLAIPMGASGVSVSAAAAVYGGLDLAQLPVMPGQPAPGLLPLLTTLQLIMLARSFTAAPPASTVQTLYELITGINSGTLSSGPQAQAALAAITGWPLADIEAFAPALALNWPSSYAQPAAYAALRTLETMSTTVNASGPVVSTAATTLVAAIPASTANTPATITVASAIGFPAPNFYINIGSEILLVTAFGGADNTIWTVLRGQDGTTAPAAAADTTVSSAYGAQLVSWGNVPPDEVTAESMGASALGILKAQQASETAWETLAPTLMNPIRQNQSAALQAWLIAQRNIAGNPLYPDDAGLANSNGLFKYFLIDTQMTSCMQTSRIVQAYIAVQTFVERCLMNLEEPRVVVNLNTDDTWSQWEWMSRYRVWEANREVFLYPENWLIESQRPNRTEIYETFEQQVQQGQSTADYLETVVLNYIGSLDGLAHLKVTGTCEDPNSDPSNPTIYVVARTLADPPVFYLRSLVNGAWGGWAQIPLDIKAHQAIPAVYRGRVCLFWIDLKVSNEPNQTLPPVQASNLPPQQDVDRYVTIGVYFSIFQNGSWAPAQTSKGKLFDKPLLTSQTVGDLKTVEALYTLKVQAASFQTGYGTNLYVDVFRFSDYNVGDVADAKISYTFVNTWESQTPQASTSITNAASAYQAYLQFIQQAMSSSTSAVHVGRAVFDGRFSDLELNNSLMVAEYNSNVGQGSDGTTPILAWAQYAYGPDAQPLLPLTNPGPDLVGEPNLLPQAGALVTVPTDPNSGANPNIALTFSSAGAQEQNVGTLLKTAQVPFRVVGPDTDLNFDPTSYFFFQDNRRCYYVESTKYYASGSQWSPKIPSDPASVPYEVRYWFHVFYHPFTRLFWNQLAGGGFDLLYDPSQQYPATNLQENPDQVDPSKADQFSFGSNYNPVSPFVQWDHDDVTVADRQFLDYRSNASFAVYNWELFYHIPLFVAQQLSQNQQFEDARTWFHYIFNPTRQTASATTTLTAAITAIQTTITVASNFGFPTPFFPISIGNEILFVTSLGSNNTTWTVLRGQQATTAAAAPAGTVIQLSNPVPGRFWIPKPLHNLTSAQIMAQNINNLLTAVNQGNQTAVNEVETWRSNPFNPFVLADQRPVAYMKSTVMAYLDNLIAWGDNLFSTESREALSEATLLYVLASEILGPAPQAVTPAPYANESFNQLEPSLDAFANAMVEIENVIGGAGGGGTGTGSASGSSIPPAQTFYFQIPPNSKLLGYWTTVADRLFKLRNCQNIGGAPLQLALFDAPIDPGLLIQAQAAGVDLSSVLSDVSVALPNYRFTSLYPQALDFVNAVRAYGASLQAALEKVDAGTLALLQQTTQQQLLTDGSDVLDWQVQVAQSNIDSLNQAVALAQQKYNFNNSQPFANAAEITGTSMAAAASVTKAIAGAAWSTAAGAAAIPDMSVGVMGFGGSPVAVATIGGTQAAKGGELSAKGIAAGIADIVSAAAAATNTIGSWQHRQDNWTEAAVEAQIQMAQTNAQLTGANLALQIAQQNQTLHQEQIDNLQKQIDFLNNKFTNNDLYNWMVGSLAATYFQSYQLAYQMCKQAERCYQFELGIPNSTFIQFGYWDSLYKGLLAGETLNNDLRRLQASYLQQNARRYEMSRYVSLGQLNPAVLQTLLTNGVCYFTLPESLFDNDYPGHYCRRLTRMSVTVVYPNPGKFDNVKATLTMLSNQVRTKTNTSSGYPEQPVGADPRFVYNYAANAQKIALGNAQDDPGLFITTLSSNIADLRYLPFENAGAISSWKLEMPQSNNEIDLTTVGDVVIHLYYTALDGGGEFQTAVQANNTANLPTSGIKVFSAQNDFIAPPSSGANAKPVPPWQAFLYPPTAGGNQVLTLIISPAKFPAWTRGGGKTITVTSLTVFVLAWPPGTFILTPQAPLPNAAVTMTQVAATKGPNVFFATLPVTGTLPETWSFQIQPQGVANFTSLTPDTIGDVLLMVSYSVS